MASVCWVSQQVRPSPAREEREEDKEVLEVSECGGGGKLLPRILLPRRVAREMDWGNIG
jgi:hypothetical protein